MTLIELAKEILEFYSENKTFTMSYSKKMLFKKDKVNDIIIYGNTKIGRLSFVKNNKVINDLNTKILDKNFNINITFNTIPLSTMSIELVKILISKLAHLDRDLSDWYFDEKEKNKLLKNNDFNKLFYNFLIEYINACTKFYYRHYDSFRETHQPLEKDLIFEQKPKTIIMSFGDSLDIEIESSTHPLSKSEGILMTYASIFCNISNTKSTGGYGFRIDYIKSNTIDFPFFGIYEKQDEIQKIIKELCPILLKIGDIENFLKLFAFSDFNINDTATIVPVINWCIENNRDDLIKQPLDILKKIQPYHSQIVEADKFLEKQQLIRKSGISLTDINQLSGIDFESLVIEKLKHYPHIAKIERTPVTKDFGADIILVTNSETKIAIQCKRFSSKVNLKAVQEVTAALKHYNADIGIVISNNGFLPSAIQLASSNNIELWGSDELLKLITQQSNFSV